MRSGCLIALMMLLPATLGAADTETILTGPVTLPVAPAVDAPTANPGCVPACACGPRFWFDFESLAWWVKGAPLSAPLLTQGDATGRGALGQPGTVVLVGGHDVNFAPAPGLRFMLGTWLDDQRQFGLDGGYFFLARQSNNLLFRSDANGLPLLAIPFFKVGGASVTNPIFTPTQSGETSTGVSMPGVFSGIADAQLTTRLESAELNVLNRSTGGGPWRATLLAGFRYLQLGETLTLDTSSPNISPASVFLSQDEFDTNNDFYGGQVGGRLEYNSGNAALVLTGKLAMGTMQERVRINGGLLTNDLNNFGPLQAFPGGYFALPSNIGTYHHGEFAVVPELGLNAGYWLTSWVRVSLGYSFLYISDVARPGDQIDRVINTLQAPAASGNPPAPLVGPARPAFSFHQDDYWAHGLNFGLEFRF